MHSDSEIPREPGDGDPMDFSDGKIKPKDRWLDKDTSKTFIYLGLIPIIAHFFFALALEDYSYSSIALSYLGLLLWALGYLINNYNYLVAAARTEFGKLLLRINHAAVALFVLYYAREILSSATGLPPQDFDLTVLIVGLPIYLYGYLLISITIPALLSITIVILIPLFQVLCIYLSFLFAVFIFPVVILVSAIFPGAAPTIDRLKYRFDLAKSKTSALLNKTFISAIGAMSVFFVALIAATWIETKIDTVKNFARHVAYYADYHEQANNPYACPHERMHVHANGIMSYARLDKELGAKIRIINLAELGKIEKVICEPHVD